MSTTGSTQRLRSHSGARRPSQPPDGSAPAPSQLTAQMLSVRLFRAGLGAAELMTAFLGLELGLYQALSDLGASRPAEVAERAGLDERMTREWLEQQTAAGLVVVDDDSKAPGERRFELPAQHAEALLDSTSPHWIAPLVVMPIGGMASVLPQLVAAYKSRTGLPSSAYGPAMRSGQADLNRGVFDHELEGWIAKHLPDVEARLHTADASITDVGCGSGLSTLALAKMFPQARIRGIDRDPDCLAEARRRLAGTALAGRVTFTHQDAAEAAATEQSQLVCIFDALHDMSRPVEVLRACKELLAPRGAIMLMEPAVAEQFHSAPADSERFHYAVSVLHCLPVGMSESPSAATGTVMRPETVRQYSREAGLDCQVIDVGHQFYRLYRLQQTASG